MIYIIIAAYGLSKRFVASNRISSMALELKKQGHKVFLITDDFDFEIKETY